VIHINALCSLDINNKWHGYQPFRLHHCYHPYLQVEVCAGLLYSSRPQLQQYQAFCTNPTCKNWSRNPTAVPHCYCSAWDDAAHLPALVVAILTEILTWIIILGYRYYCAISANGLDSLETAELKRLILLSYLL
jgi:hypothetical protein